MTFQIKLECMLSFNMRKYLLVILILSTLLLLIIIGSLLKKHVLDKRDEDNSSKISFTTSAWIPYWDFSRGLETLQSNQEDFNSVSPVIYEPLENGDLKELNGKNYQKIQAYSQENDIKFVPSVALFDHNISSDILNDEKYLNNHIEKIVLSIKNNKFDGIDLDYESTKLEDKEKYQEFISRLGTEIAKLEETEGRELTFSVTVLAKWETIRVYPSLKETRQVQDWEYIAEHADEIRIMAYDFFNQYSSEPGPIAPTFWIEDILNKAVKEIPKEKIVLGIHTYSYNWAASDIKLDLRSILGTEAKLQADAYTYDQVQEILNKYPHTIHKNTFWGEKYIEYQREEKDRILVYTDAETIQMRRDIAKEYGIKGVSYWRLGGDILLDY